MRSFKEYDSGDQIKDDDIWGAREQKQWVWNVCWETWKAKTISGRPSYRWEDDVTSHKTSAPEYNNNETFGVTVPRCKIHEYNTKTPRTFLTYAMEFLRILATD